MRGEYDALVWARVGETELPPRARRIRRPPFDTTRSSGTTSACAENTQPCYVGFVLNRNYLRVRGEYPYRGGTFFLSPELPPRARRIHGIAHADPTPQGTTSACAENTCVRPVSMLIPRNYLRVRGEYVFSANSRTDQPELPPRARRILNKHRGGGGGVGTTSACAENTQHRDW